MKTLRNLILFLGLILLSQNLFAQKDTNDNTFILSGKLFDAKTMKGVAYGHILVEETRWGTVCDSLGFFRIRIHPDQQLRITAIGFSENITPVTVQPNQGEAFMEIPMERASYLLEEVNVYSLGTWEQFKYNFVHSKAPEKPKNIAQSWKMPNLKLEHQTAMAIKRQGFGLSFGGGKQKNRSIEKVERLMAQEYYQDLLNQKFNRQIVQNLTGETGKRLDALMVFINDRQMFTHQTSAYFIGIKIKEYYKEYLQVFPPVQGNYALTDSLQNEPGNSSFNEK